MVERLVSPSAPLGLTALPSHAQTSVDPTAAIRPFRIDMPPAALADLRHRVNATEAQQVVLALK